MSEESPVSGDDSDIVHVPTNDDTPISPLEAARSLTDFRRKQAAGEAKAEAPVKAAEPEPTPPQEDAAAPAEEATSEQATETTEPESTPPIEPPRSWTKEEKAEFATYPREAQEKIARREQDRETALRRGQNEIAEQRKAFEAQRQQVEQAKTQYESALPQLLQTLHQQQQGEFADIRTMADVQKLANEDWPRYAKWDAQQKQIAAVSQEVRNAEQRQQSEKQAKWSEFTNKEDAAFLERNPDMADPEKAAKTARQSLETLKNAGYSESELTNLWHNNEVFRDHRMQEMIRDASRWRDAQKTVPTKVAVKPVPPVQRPGTSGPRASDDDVRIKTLEQKLEKSGDWKDAAALIAAKRSARG